MQTSVVENGPEAYFTMLPVFRMVEKMKENGIPASVNKWLMRISQRRDGV